MLKKLAYNLIIYPIVWLVRLLVFLRYRVVVKGLDALTPEALKSPGGILFLPNHPAEIDPVILESVLWTKFRPRPLVVEHFYNLAGFKYFIKLVKALPLPTTDAMVNKWRAKKIAKQFDRIVSELKNKANFLIYPSGRLKISGMELIGGASFVHNLLQAAPETNVVLIRTSGLWGSKFSKALTGSSPDFGKVLWECVKILLKNGIFFAPKREVIIELSLPPADFPYSAERLEFNKYLENWYNRYQGVEPGPEPIKLVSYAFWKEELPKVFVSTGGPAQTEERPVSDKIQKEVFDFLSSLCGKPADQIERKMQISFDLGLDSLDSAQVYVFLDEHYGVAHLVPGDIQTVEDVLQFAAGYKKEGSGTEEKPGASKFTWPEEKRDPPKIADGETIHASFLRRVSESGSQTATLDALSGPLTYSRVKLGAIILSNKIRNLPGERIGIMLPASSGAYLIILGVMLAGKTPVMLNWTAGVKALDHSVDLAGVQAVITSDKFLDRVEGGEFGKMEQMFHMIEEIRRSVGLIDKLCALLLSKRSPEALLKKFKLTAIKPSDPAVILFTSGTESLPKGVPLSHANLLSNQRACLQAANLLPEDILYGVLPPFHSFGFSVTGILPILAGLRICFAPDPTDSHGMARDVGQWKPTLFCCAPSFIKAMFRVAKPEQLQSLRLVVAGAEKTPQELFDYVKQHLPKGHLLEGYGITECSPVVTLDRQDAPHRGVGCPLPNIELMILDQQTNAPVEEGKEGEICIAGPSVFAGYLGNPRTPFVTVSGKQWYLSGDLGYLEEKKYLILSGRLKRFVKIGGEMVGLGGLEEELLRLAHEKNWIKGGEEGPPLAVSVKEKDTDKPQIILFTTLDISKEVVNEALKNSGYGRIVKISEVRKLEQIPLTGTGKTHYRLLDEMLT